MGKNTSDLSSLLDIDEINELEKQTIDRLNFYQAKLSAVTDLFTP